MNDLEHDLRTMLSDRADAVTPAPDAREAIQRRIATGTPADVIPLADRRRPLWIPAVAAAAVIAAVALAAGSAIRDDRPTEVSVASQPPTPDADPADLPGSDAPIFGVGVGYSDPNVAATDYLSSRDIGPRVAIEPAVIDGDEAVVHYLSYQDGASGDGERLELASGDVFLWEGSDGWVVRAAIADGVIVDEAFVEMADDSHDRLEIAGQVSTEQGELSLRVTSPDGDSLLPDEGRPRGRTPLRGVPAYSAAFTLAPASGYVQVVVEVTGGTIFAVTEFSVAAPDRPLLRLPQGTDPVQGAMEFVATQGWQPTGEATMVDGGERIVLVETETGTVQVRFSIDAEGRFVVWGAWDQELDQPAFEVRDAQVTGRWQAPVAGEATVSITPFFSTFPDETLVPVAVEAGEIRQDPTPHPSDGFEPVIVSIRLLGSDGVERRAVVAV